MPPFDGRGSTWSSHAAHTTRHKANDPKSLRRLDQTSPNRPRPIVTKGRSPTACTCHAAVPSCDASPGHDVIPARGIGAGNASSTGCGDAANGEAATAPMMGQPPCPEQVGPKQGAWRARSSRQCLPCPCTASRSRTGHAPRDDQAEGGALEILWTFPVCRCGTTLQT